MSLMDMEKRAVLQILAYLYKAEKATRTDLRDNVNAALKSIYSTLPVLMKLGLISEEVKESFPFTVSIMLTEKGKKVAHHLVEIQNILVL